MAGIETGCPYYLYDPSLTHYVAFNTPTDANFVGYINSVTGLDMGGIRENAQVIVAGDGGYHGPFWRDRRPWTLGGFIVPAFTLLARDRAQENIEGIMGATDKKDGYLFWNPADGIQKQIAFRMQQPVRIGNGQGPIEKTFQIAGVCEDYRIRSAVLNGETGTNVTPECINRGNADASPIITMVTSYANPSAINSVTGKGIYIVGNPTNQTITIDMTGRYPTVVGSVTGNMLGYVNPLTTEWTTSVARTDWNPGQTFTLTGGGSITVEWYDSWQ